MTRPISLRPSETNLPFSKIRFTDSFSEKELVPEEVPPSSKGQSYHRLMGDGGV